MSLPSMSFPFPVAICPPPPAKPTPGLPPALMTLCSPGPQIWIPEQGTSGVLPQRAPRPLRGEDQALFLDPRAWRIHLPFPRPGDNGGSPRGGRGGPDSGQGPQASIPQSPKALPSPDSQTLPSFSLEPQHMAQCSTYTPSPNFSCPDPPAALLPALTALHAFRSQAEQEKGGGEGPGAHDAGRVGGHPPFGPLNTPAMWGPTPNSPHCE